MMDNNITALEKSLIKNGYNIDKFRKLNRSDKKELLKRWEEIFKISNTSRKQNDSVYIVIINDKKKNFYAWLKTSKIGTKIK